MATFLPPLAGANPIVQPPRRTLLDESGHRAVLLSRVTGQANVTAVAPIRSYAKPIQVGADFLLEFSPLPSSAEATVPLAVVPSIPGPRK